MTKVSGSGPVLATRQEAERQARVAREAAALRDNLHRRKQQARERKDAAPLPANASPAGGGTGSRDGDCPSG